MVHSRVVVLLVALICIGIATATFDNDKLSQEDGDLTKREFLEGKKSMEIAINGHCFERITHIGIVNENDNLEDSYVAWM